ncbi:MAG: S-methyl-5'-thioinosine phosphorylase [Gammaproteobacteria bacterium]|nr:S-methyl-5'-thioinosine phosphorylase [Gammaproteobacteria bacterium]
MALIGIIGGSGLASLEGLAVSGQKIRKTPYGPHSGILTFGKFVNQEVVFLPRHGNPHVIPPHKINYRANVWALNEVGADRILAINAVGGITGNMRPGRIVIPDQIIDYTWGRGHTFFEDGLNDVVHVDFSRPYSEPLRQTIIDTGAGLEMDLVKTATYGATQGPRLETASEILRMEKDGCDLVGMTGMPEAALAREIGVEYASICMVVNWAAGKCDDEITMEVIDQNLQECTAVVRKLLSHLFNSL